MRHTAGASLAAPKRTFVSEINQRQKRDERDSSHTHEKTLLFLSSVQNLLNSSRVLRFWLIEAAANFRAAPPVRRRRQKPQLPAPLAQVRLN